MKHEAEPSFIIKLGNVKIDTGGQPPAPAGKKWREQQETGQDHENVDLAQQPDKRQVPLVINVLKPELFVAVESVP